MADSLTSQRPSSAGPDAAIDPQDPIVTVKRIGLHKAFAMTESGTPYVRTHKPDGTKTPWEKVETPPDDLNTQPTNTPKQLYLVRHNQVEDQRLHWSLETANVEAGDLTGNIYQVSGDAEFMDYRPNQDGVPVPTLSNPDIRDYFLLIPELTPDMEDTVKKVAAAEPPPQAPSRREVKENCQSWAIRVMKKLVELGMMDAQKVTDCKARLQPIRD